VWVVVAATCSVLLLRSAPWGLFVVLLLRLLLGLGGEIYFLFFSVPVFFELRSICFLYFEVYFLYLQIYFFYFEICFLSRSMTLSPR
jgi:hypothetical protein